MKKLMLIGVLTALLSGCQYFDLDGNGRFDPIAYLEGVDITVAWVGEDGQVYNVAIDELGKQLLGQFIQAETGYLFEITDEGGIAVTDPSGIQVQLKRK